MKTRPFAAAALVMSHAEASAIERFVDQHVLARRDGRQRDRFLGDRGRGDVNGVDVGRASSAVDSFNRRSPGPLGDEALRILQPPARNGRQTRLFCRSIASATTPAIMPVPTMPNPN